MLIGIIIFASFFMGAWCSLTYVMWLINKRGWLEWRGEYAMQGKAFWHGAETIPKTGKVIWVKFKGNKYPAYVENKNDGWYEKNSEDIERWAYIEDLDQLPGKTS